jgi:hypothetical protein
MRSDEEITMTVIYRQEEHIHTGYPHWDRRAIKAHTPFTHNDREHRGQEFSVEKSEYSVEIEFQTGEGDFARSFTHDEFNEFIRQCQWVADCKV